MLPFLYVAILGHITIPAPAYPDAPLAIRGPRHGAASSANSSPETPIEILSSTSRRMGWAELVRWTKSRRKGVDVMAAVPAAPGRNQRRLLSGEGIRDDGRRRRIHRRASASPSSKGGCCADIAIVGRSRARKYCVVSLFVVRVALRAVQVDVHFVAFLA